MPKFNITVTHLEQTTYCLDAETWQDAVELASERADEDGLETAGGFAVRDENHRPVDTFDGRNL